MVTDDQALKAIIDSDRAYFAAGANVLAIPGGSVTWMAGLDALWAGACAHLLDPAPALGAPGDWVVNLVGRFEAIGRHYARVYLPAPVPALESALREAGFAPSRETAYLAPVDGRVEDPATNGFSCRAVEEHRDWEAKLAINHSTDSHPDGKPGTAEDWLDLERRKVDAGYMRPYIVAREGRVIAAFSVAPAGEVLRLKNVLVHAAFRRQGAASAAITFARELALTQGYAGLGLLALTGGRAEPLYMSRGLAPVGHVTEYIRTP